MTTPLTKKDSRKEQAPRAQGSPKKCTPVWGSCNLPAGHKGQHNAQAQWPPQQRSESGKDGSPASGEQQKQEWPVTRLEMGGDLVTALSETQPGDWPSSVKCPSTAEIEAAQQDNWNLKVGQALPHLPACKQGEACTCPYGYGENVIQATQPRRNFGSTEVGDMRNRPAVPSGSSAPSDQSSSRGQQQEFNICSAREWDEFVQKHDDAPTLATWIAAKCRAAAERQRREQAGKELGKWRKDFVAIVEDRRQVRQQLLSALAAIETHNKECPHECYEIVL